jgi:DNA-binding PadR family transcriptional regulator
LSTSQCFSRTWINSVVTRWQSHHQQMMEKIDHHGYRIGPGTLYPLLPGLERTGLLKSQLKNVEGRRRRVYRITPAGRKVLGVATTKVDELHQELHEEHPLRIAEISGSVKTGRGKTR